MTATLTSKSFTSTLLGANGPMKAKSPIGVISYNTTTGQVKQCEVFTPFWEKSSTPDTVECTLYLMNSGFGLIRQNTIKYNSLV